MGDRTKEIEIEHTVERPLMKIFIPEPLAPYENMNEVERREALKDLKEKLEAVQAQKIVNEMTREHLKKQFYMHLVYEELEIRKELKKIDAIKIPKKKRTKVKPVV